jgi:hypothetical protein
LHISTNVDIKKMDLLKPDVISSLNEDVWDQIDCGYRVSKTFRFTYFMPFQEMDMQNP